MKVFIGTAGNWEYSSLFLNEGHQITKDYKEADLFVFTGGADVSPRLYGAKAHPSTYCDGLRDEVEKTQYAWCFENDVPMVGICRGGQFLNVMNGGIMYQNVTRHTGPHYMEIGPGRSVLVTSTHHQMMKPASHAIILAKAVNHYTEREWYEGDKLLTDESEEGIEVVLYKETRCLCFQPHPEMMQDNQKYNDMRDVFFSYLNLIV